MKELFVKYNIELTESQNKNFEKYCDLLLEYNEKFNITAITERREIYVKHFIDSVLNYKMLKSGNLLDIGAGGGFPSLPIKILRDDIEETLLEANAKKCMFLQTVVDELELKNVKIICGRAEEFAKKAEYREKFDTVTARAVARLNVLSEYALPFVKKGGQFLAYKGEKGTEEINESENAIKILGGKIKNINETELEGAKRFLIYIEKTEKTPEKYPRNNAQIQKKSL